MSSSVKLIDLTQVDEASFKKRFVGCVVLTQDNKILLQQRPDHWKTYPGYQAEFGGHIEADETPNQAIIRELHEELGAQVKDSELIHLGAVTEESTNHSEIVHVYFWHDALGTITGCYEGEENFYNNTADALAHPKMMLSVKWLLQVCNKKGLTP